MRTNVNRLHPNVNQLMLVDFLKIVELNPIILSDHFCRNFSSVNPNEVRFEALER